MEYQCYMPFADWDGKCNGHTECMYKECRKKLWEEKTKTDGQKYTLKHWDRDRLLRDISSFIEEEDLREIPTREEQGEKIDAYFKHIRDHQYWMKGNQALRRAMRRAWKENTTDIYDRLWDRL